MNDDAPWLIDGGDGGCTTHGDRAMAVCALCGAEFCALCFPASNLCPCCAAAEPDDDALEAPLDGTGLTDSDGKHSVEDGDLGVGLAGLDNDDPLEIDEAGAETPPEVNEAKTPAPRLGRRKRAGGRREKAHAAAAVSPASGRVGRRSEKKRSSSVSRARRARRSRRA